MKKTSYYTLTLVIQFTLLVILSSAATAADLKTTKEKYSYAIGFQIGNGLKKDNVDVDVEALKQGVKDVLSGAKTKVSMEEMQAAVLEMQKAQQAAREVEGEKAKKAGADFLAANKKKKGVKTLKSGIQYKVIKEGKGSKPTASDSVVAHYKGTLIDGTEFDSSYKRGQPATFGVGQVIKGWQEILPLMPSGSTWQVFIPSDLAYGPRGAGPNIGPNETLVFDIELLEVKPGEAKK
ncbi:FKBP-type peptidyl-prolyl cis-trans isomerase [Kaarinaea lacus]